MVQILKIDSTNKDQATPPYMARAGDSKDEAKILSKKTKSKR